MGAAERFGRNLYALRKEAGFIAGSCSSAEVFMDRDILVPLSSKAIASRASTTLVRLARAIDVQVRDLLYGIE